MQPDISKITITDNLCRLEHFIANAIIAPRKIMKEWSLVTNQTPAVKIGYVGQHLASLITGVAGTGSGARGDDLIDGTEVKSCNKVDQVDKCKDCNGHVMRYESKCSTCGSEKIARKDDSKWLFSVRDEHELNQYLGLERILLILMDYPKFSEGDFKDIRITAYEIYPKEDRASVFRDLINNHYYNIYLPKITGKLKEDVTKGNPMNLHPFGFQFFKCNPVLTFSCIIKDIDSNPEIHIDKDAYVLPEQDRPSSLPSMLMPTQLLKEAEWRAFLEKANYETEVRPLLTENVPYDELCRIPIKRRVKILPFIDEKLRGYIPLRDIKPVIQKAHYQR